VHVLVIDGNGLSVQDLNATLTIEGFQVFCCDSYMEACELTHVYEFDVILVNHIVSETSADIERLRRANVATPILALSDDGSDLSCIAVLKHGADDCLSKPYHRAELVARLRTIVRSSLTQLKSTVVPMKVVLEMHR
jgi:two-component system, cell cycle response regulator CtrA